MRAEYDFSKGTRGALISTTGKTRISIFIDNAILATFRQRAEAAGVGYQTMMNEALKQYLAETTKPLTEKRLREILVELLPSDSERLSRRSSGRAKNVVRR
jgi:BrnA antitoxin of type II toxin-antitoxin system